ncbi:MAG: DUF2789 domain-containing protein [Thermomicrobiales bacterium]|jgi:hypothetical protein|nr:MAG: DUF2789 domain-containing protein [Thermomicrobiales bacterium]
MEHAIHSMSNLFSQLGKPSDEVAIAKFIETHAPLPSEMQFHEAGFWTSAQSSFLCDAISDDADWADVAESLNSQLHERK